MIYHNYTKRDTSIIKGFAILSIVLHNYFHWLAPSPGENEFDFSSRRVLDFFQLLRYNSQEFFNILFSYFGHYGVQLFIMVSGFGLAVSMINQPKTWESFMLGRLKKLYPLLVTGIVFYFFGMVLMEGKMFGVYEKRELGYKLLLIHTLIPNSGLSLVGPWWFFGLIFQLYLLFPLLFHWMEKWGWKVFFTVSVLSYGFIFLFRDALNLFQGTILMQNAPGHLPEFCLGMMLAFHKERKIHWIWLVLALVFFVLGNFFSGFYPFTFLSLCVVAVFAYQGLKSIPVKKSWLSVPLAYFGNISMALFVVHGFFRTPILKVAITMPGPWGHFVSGLLFLFLVWGVALAAKALYGFFVAQLDRIHISESKWTRRGGCFFAIMSSLFFLSFLWYYLAQNINGFDNKVTTSESQLESGIVKKDTQTLSLSNLLLDQRCIALRVDASFDVYSLDTLSPLPSIVLEIDDLIWTKIDISNEYNTSISHRYEFVYDYVVPWVKNTKGKRIKLYFWNPQQGAMQFDNAIVNLYYKE